MSKKNGTPVADEIKKIFDDPKKNDTEKIFDAILNLANKVATKEDIKNVKKEIKNVKDELTKTIQKTASRWGQNLGRLVEIHALPSLNNFLNAKYESFASSENVFAKRKYKRKDKHLIDAEFDNLILVKVKKGQFRFIIVEVKNSFKIQTINKFYKKFPEQKKIRNLKFLLPGGKKYESYAKVIKMLGKNIGETDLEPEDIKEIEFWYLFMIGSVPKKWKKEKQEELKRKEIPGKIFKIQNEKASLIQIV